MEIFADFEIFSQSVMHHGRVEDDDNLLENTTKDDEVSVSSELDVDSLSRPPQKDAFVSMTSVAEVIEFLGMGKFHVLLVAAVGYVFTVDSMSFLALTFYLPCLRQDLQTTWNGWLDAAIASAGFVGFMFGSWIWGTICDAWGRRPATLLVCASLATAQALQVFSGFAVPFALFLRFLMGLATSGAFASYALVAEYSPHRWRPVLLCLVQSCFAIGSVMSASLAFVTMEISSSSSSSCSRWPLFVLVSSIFPALAILPCLWLPESARFLSVHHLGDAVRRTLDRIARLNRVSLSSVSFHHIVDSSPSSSSSNPSSSWRSTIDRVVRLFQHPLLRTTLTLCPVWFFSSFVYYGVVFLSPLLFASADSSPALSTITTSVAEAFFLLSCGFASQRFGYKMVIFCGFALASVSLLLMGIVRTHSYGVMLLLSLLMRGGASSSFACITMVTVDMYPTSCRATGIGVCSSASRTAGIITPFIALPLFETSPWIPIAIYACACAVACLLTTIMPYKSTDAMAD